MSEEEWDWRLVQAVRQADGITALNFLLAALDGAGLAIGALEDDEVRGKLIAAMSRMRQMAQHSKARLNSQQIALARTPTKDEIHSVS